MNKIVILSVLLSLIFTACLSKENSNEKVPVKPQTNLRASKNLSAPAQTLVDANNKFTFSLLNEKSSENTNLFFSSISIFSALNMLYAGSEGTTKSELKTALNISGFNDPSLYSEWKKLTENLNYEENVKLNFLNSLWISNSFSVKENYKTLISDSFYAYIKDKCNFTLPSTLSEVNGWIETSTNGMIKNMLTQDDISSASFLLINGTYFKGEWQTLFDKNKTYTAAFENNDSSTSAALMMSSDREVSSYSDNNVMAVNLPYKGKEVSMYLFMPTNTSFDDYCKNFSYEYFNSISAKLSSHHIYFSIPKFKIDYGVCSLKNSLKNMGINEIFSPISNLSGISESASIEDILHKAVIDVNEEGTEAAAATAVIGTTSTLPYLFSKPFVFFIKDEVTGVILFAGKVSSLPKQ